MLSTLFDSFPMLRELKFLFGVRGWDGGCDVMYVHPAYHEHTGISSMDYEKIIQGRLVMFCIT